MDGVDLRSRSPSWSIMTCLRWDRKLQEICKDRESSGYYMLRYHQERMRAAASDFGWYEAKQALTGNTGMANLTKALDDCLMSSTLANTFSRESIYKLRVLLSYDRRLTVSSPNIAANEVENWYPTSLSPPISGVLLSPIIWRVYISPLKTTPSLHTKHKTTNRSVYDEVRKHIPPAESYTTKTAEILVVNSKNEIMEGSITTPYFYRNGRWVTPCADAGGNLGTTRRWALENGLCEEEAIIKTDVKVGEEVWLSNGVRGWGAGKIVELPG